ncbi:type VI secretion system accessory protein TagJ [Parachitinimonas caeni]|uniref:Type VI secretion system accessory protein TagJ n=1 Tax=Parachitinimonas caeni TaxID=3031301 RepID=A0ABT7E2K1_9NEIS|nr:type VI secretion system accessory protein TagJ [Parachitinimonas caeni]MDK2126547.1 type VI secretion system accessory protein TagJ [Parachitinimonas caeni]
MTDQALALLKEGRPDDALAALTSRIRQAPDDAPARVFMFQLLAVLGQWQRATAQLDAAAELDPACLALAAIYRDAIRCETDRAAVFAGQHPPALWGEPLPWLQQLVQSIHDLAHHKADSAAALRETAFETAPAVAGEIDGVPFEWIADADSRLGPVLEVFMNNRYHWVAFEQLKSVKIEAPVDLRDVLWLPAVLQFANGIESGALLPARYPGSELADDRRLALCRKTDWQPAPHDLWLGLGQKLLATDSTELALLDVREIRLNV